MKSERGSDKIFGVPPQMKLNPPPSPAERQISSRSDFIHLRWISSAGGGFSWKKHLPKQVLFSGRDSRTRTYECQSQSLVPYRLGYSPISFSLHPLIKYSSGKMGWIIGIEPMTSSATNWRSADWAIPTMLARLKRLELLAHCLEGSCSILLSYRRIYWSGWWESNPRNQLGRLMFYHWTTPAQPTFKIIADYCRFVNYFFQFF